MTYNDITFLISVFFLPIWLVWELVILLWLRPQGVQTDGGLAKTISMIMQQRAYIFTCIPLFWASMMAHWWFNWIRNPVWKVPAPSIIFWSFVGLTLIVDVILWRSGIGFSSLPSWAKGYRAPMVQCLVGIVMAYLLFPQQAPGQGFRWW
jgi:uncharacterized protein YacL